MSEPPGRVWKQMGKAALVLAVSAVAVPYTVAAITNTFYGWPNGRDRYKRALHPRKVYCLNYALLQQLGMLRYAGLYFNWKKYYRNAPDSRIIKNIPYGKNNNNLDLYFPLSNPESGFRPVIIFIYGGSWGSGDKNMYSLLCSQIADKLNALVVCPNYSIYPKGYVDDMVQDVVHCLQWIHKEGFEYGADKERILLLGHSAGAHLVTMATTELVMKRLLTNPESLIASGPNILEYSRQSSVFDESMQFEESYFNGSGMEASNASSQQVAAESSSGSFYFVEKGDKGTPSRQVSGAESFTVLDKDDNNKENEELESKSDTDPDAKTTEETKTKPSDETDFTDVNQGQGDGIENTKDKDDTEEPRLDLSALESSEIQEEEEEVEEIHDDLSQSQRDIRDLLSSIRAVIGLAGVYHIGDHYKHEEWRGVEDVSSMAKAMYGPDFFDRFSPSHIVPNLPQNTRFPPIHLIHGDKDKTVPMESSTKFGQALWELGSKQVQVTLLPGCGHKDICVDLMDPQRSWYDPVMNAIMETAQRFL